MTIRCITFDLDDTLWECEPVLFRAETIFYRWLAENSPRVASGFSPDALIEHRRNYFAEYPELHHDVTRLRKQWLAHVLSEADYGEQLVEAGFKVFWQARNEIALGDETVKVLEGLRGLFMMGAITNGNADVDRIGIGRYFDFVVTAAEAGAAKPDVRIFQMALAKSKISAPEVVHVGDDPDRDILGARAVGMRTIWINAKQRPWQAQEVPDAIIHTLGELQAVLASWVRS